VDTTTRVLVGYANAAGSTGSIAGSIAAVLSDAGVTVPSRSA